MKNSLKNSRDLAGVRILPSKFEENLAKGKVGEGKIARWLRKRHNFVLPVYELETEACKGPVLFTPSGEVLRATDLLVFGACNPQWIEAKDKNAWSWYRKCGLYPKWVTGVDLANYKDYCDIDDLTPWPVWLLFLQNGGLAKDTPLEFTESPTGLFGNSIEYLREHESHRSERHAKGMVYWHISAFKRIAPLEDL